MSWTYTRQFSAVLIPDLWGKSSDTEVFRITCFWVCLNPRFVGQVFRRRTWDVHTQIFVLIPDLWGKSSDQLWGRDDYAPQVLIPDLWGKSSDRERCRDCRSAEGLNPRFVGQVFRLDMTLLACNILKS